MNPCPGETSRKSGGGSETRQVQECGERRQSVGARRTPEPGGLRILHQTFGRSHSDMDSIFDPRGFRAAPPVQLAPRPAALVSRRILILDNEKLLGRPNYDPLLPNLESFLRGTAGASECPVWRRTVLAVGAEELARLTDELSAAAPDAVVLLLGDAGAVSGTLLLAIRLEARGIPTVTLVTPVAASLAGAVAQAGCPVLG